MPAGGGDGGAAMQEAQRQAAVKQADQHIDSNFAGFDDGFFKKAGTDYTAAEAPQMFSDYRTTRNNLTYALARGGMLDSGSAVNRNSGLQRQLATNESTVANNAADAENKLRTGVAGQKSNLYQLASSGADPAQINAQSVAATSGLRAPSPIQPLGNLFADWSQQYLTSKAMQMPAQNPLAALMNQGYGTVGGGSGSSYMVN